MSGGATRTDKILKAIQTIEKSSLPKEERYSAVAGLKCFLVDRERNKAMDADVDENWHLEICPVCRNSFTDVPTKNKTEYCRYCGQKVRRA